MTLPASWQRLKQTCLLVEDLTIGWVATIILCVVILYKHMDCIVNDRKNLLIQSFFDSGGFKPVFIGQRLRQFRIEKGLSIRTLAENSGLSVNTLSLIENQKSSPSVNTLEQLARTLEMPMAQIFEPLQEDRQLIYTQAGHRREIWLDGIRVEDCGLDLSDQPMHPLVITLPPGSGSGADAIHHSGYEFVYCLSGVIEYFVDDKKLTMQAGDSLIFNAQHPHRWDNQGEDPVVYLLIMMPGEIKDFPADVHFFKKS